MVLVTNCADCVKRVYPNRSRVPSTDRDSADPVDEASTTSAGTLTD
ncbi:hypothetical protein HISP_15400 [Haloarcula hispanica N601]|uniref:Uncharacterized protein n=2 Tax=Haloarcula hispanica TaxID=51589 RepID=V5TRR5_HALHI|nr:conserved hypothetical protein [Haloarcula hispanica ATCC 33960]AHB67325.1 hypothetical protein HISP_15400 [Haloarcula hispanica N601]